MQTSVRTKTMQEATTYVEFSALEFCDIFQLTITQDLAGESNPVSSRAHRIRCLPPRKLSGRSSNVDRLNVSYSMT